MNHVIRAARAALLSAAFIAAPAFAGVTNTFTGEWAPTAANGFENAVGAGGSPSTFTTSVSADGTVLTAHIANNGDWSHPSFFLQNYSFLTTPLLRSGQVRYDYEIELFSPTGSVMEFDDFGRGAAWHASGTKLTGTVDFMFNGGYFSYFGINIADFDGTASAVVTLTNFSAPLPEPESLALTAVALAGLALARRRVRSAH